jgi:endonuclease YncB( thermonuclease family)
MKWFCFTCCVSEDADTLQEYNADNTVWLSLDGQKLRCKVVDVYDADTVTLIVPFAGLYFKKKCRLTGIDAAEKRTKNLEEKKVALKGQQYVSDLILNKEVWVDCGDWDKYGRLLGTIYTKKSQMRAGWDRSLNRAIVAEGFAYLYDGKKKRAFAEWHA